MDANDPTSRAGIGVVYFHGAASVRDLGPDEATAQNSGVVVVRHVRPGYDDTNPRSGASLRDVASDALDEARAMGLQSIVAVGWSGGGPYALAAGSLGRRELRGVGLVASWPRGPRWIRRTASCPASCGSRCASGNGSLGRYFASHLPWSVAVTPGTLMTSTVSHGRGDSPWQT